MKLQTPLIAITYGLVTFVFLPFFFMQMNLKLSLPIYSLQPLKFVGVILIILGAAYWIHGVLLFIYKGKGTPIPTNPPIKLVTTGVYKYTRNPMYMSVLFILLGYFFILGHVLLLLNLLIVAIFFQLFITLYEEPTLRKKFDKSYTEYCKKVPRWL